MPFESYCADADIQNAVGGASKLALLSSQSGVLDSQVVKRARMMGAEQIDAKARTLPTFDWHDNPPSLAVSVNIDLAIYNMYKLTYRKITDSVQKAYDNAVALINDIGISSAWEDTNQAASKTVGRVSYSTPNTPLGSGETRVTRMSHSSDTDWL